MLVLDWMAATSCKETFCVLFVRLCALSAAMLAGFYVPLYYVCLVQYKNKLNTLQASYFSLL